MNSLQTGHSNSDNNFSSGASRGFWCDVCSESGKLRPAASKICFISFLLFLTIPILAEIRLSEQLCLMRFSITLQSISRMLFLLHKVDSTLNQFSTLFLRKIIEFVLVESNSSIWYLYIWAESSPPLTNTQQPYLLSSFFKNTIMKIVSHARVKYTSLLAGNSLKCGGSMKVP